MTYTIYYWPMAGRAGAAIRMLDEAKVAYVHKSEFPEIASVCSAFGAAGSSFAPPVLVDGDTVISQSGPVAMYIGQKHGFDVPEGQTAKAAQFLNDFADFYSECADRVGGQKDPKKFFNERCKTWMAVLERNCKGPFFFGDKMSYVDFTVWSGFSFMKEYFVDQLKKETNIDIFDNCPKLVALCDKMNSLESFKNSKLEWTRDGFRNKISAETLAAIKA